MGGITPKRPGGRDGDHQKVNGVTERGKVKTRPLYQTDGRLVKWGAIIEDKNITILSHGERAAEIEDKTITLHLDPLTCSKSDLRAICAGIEQEAGVNGLTRRRLAEYNEIGGYKLEHNY